MADQLQLRGGTTTDTNNFTGAPRELTIDTTKNTAVVHDGFTTGGHPLAKESEVVKNTGDQTVTGIKTFDGDLNVTGDQTVVGNQVVTGSLSITGDLNSLTVERSVGTLNDLLDVNHLAVGSVRVLNYHSGLEGGGGVFYWDATKAKSEHNGGTVIDPDVTFPTLWSDQTQLATWFDTANIGAGCWVRQHDGAVNVKWFGAVGDGVTDDTVAIQACFNSTASSYLFEKSVFKVRKSTKFTSDFPSNDQPCLFLKGKSNISIYGNGAKLKVDAHAQGILEFQLCSGITVDGLEVSGSGLDNMPPIDGTSGYSEKGTSTTGYYTSGFWGYHKNNSHDTSNNTLGGFNGAFPQFSGGVSSTWGTWNGGYIGNVGNGILIHNGCENIVIRKCKASGFNYSGIQVGHRGDFSPINLDLPKSKHINIIDCYVENNYSANIGFDSVEGYSVKGCYSGYVGHINASPTHTYQDPGYGLYASRLSFEKSNPVNGIFDGNFVEKAVRKGIDSHGHKDLVISNNIVKDCYVSGIYSAWSSAIQPAIGTTIVNNIIENCATGNNKLSSIYLQGRIDDEYSYDNILLDATVKGNTIRDSGYHAINVRVGRNVNISDNIILGFSAESQSTFGYAILAGRLNDTSYNINVSNNIIEDFTGIIARGVQVTNTENGNVNGNTVLLQNSTSSNIGVYAATGCDKVNFVSNFAKIGALGVPIATWDTTGQCFGNMGQGGDSPSTYWNSNKEFMSMPLSIQMAVSFNSTTFPSFTVHSGTDFVDTVEAEATGFVIKFKNLPNLANRINATFSYGSGTAPNSGGSFPSYWYQRSTSYQSLQVGIKASNTATSSINASSLIEGTLIINITIV